MRRNARPDSWSEEDDAILLTFWTLETSREIRARLSRPRTHESLICRGKRVGLKQAAMFRPNAAAWPNAPASEPMPPPADPLDAVPLEWRWAPGDPALWPWRVAAEGG